MNLPVQSEPRQLTLRDRLNQMTPEFKKALPGHIPAEKFVRTVQTAVQMNPQIGKACNTQGGMQSLMAACTKAATDGLILDNREAALVTFRQKTGDNQYEDRVQYIPMVAGLMKKARNSGEISNISAHVVYANDQFNYVLGDEERIEHQPKFGDRGPAIAVYAIVKMKDGSVQREVMDKAAVLAIAKQSKNAGQYNPETGANFGEWWRKTVIRRIRQLRRPSPHGTAAPAPPPTRGPRRLREAAARIRKGVAEGCTSVELATERAAVICEAMIEAEKQP